MITLIKTEFQKIKRYHILLIGMIGMTCSPLLQFLSQLIINEELRDPHYNFAALIKNTIWGNTQIFMPVLFTLTVGAFRHLQPDRRRSDQRPRPSARYPLRCLYESPAADGGSLRLCVHRRPADYHILQS